MAKQAKRTKKFVKNKLDKTLKDRKGWQKKTAQVKRAKQKKSATLADRRNGRKAGIVANGGGGGDDEREAEDGASDESIDDDERKASRKNVGGGRMTVDEFLGGGFKAGVEDDDEDEDDEGDEDDEDDDLSSLGDVDDLSDDEEAHAQDLAKLAERDPEFYKYLQENDNDLLEFGDGQDEGDEEENEDSDAEEADDADDAREDVITVTSELLRQWQKKMLQTHSLRAFRRLLLAFRAAAHMGAGADEKVHLTYAVHDPKIFNKLIITSLKYVPVILNHHIGYTQTSSGKYKLPTNEKKFGGLQRSVQSYFASLHRLLRTLPEPKLLYTCVDESVKMVPYLLPNRRLAREYVKIMLELWSTSEENVRIAAFLAIRRMASAGDEVVLDLCLRGAYRGLVRNAKSMTMYSMGNINLMKNSASELFSINLDASYQQAFGFIRQLAIHLRACLKTKTQESYQAVYNWQYVHCLDFWAIVLATTCDKERTLDRGGEESVMHALIYPLVQSATGAVRLLSSSRYFPMRLHVVQSLIRLSQRTGTYIPLAPLLLEIFESPEFTRKAKPSTLTMSNFDLLIRTPKAYIRTKVYGEALADEVSYLLLHFLQSLSRSIAFPELVIPIVASLRRSMKQMKALRDSNQAKSIAVLRNLVEKIERHAAYVMEQRTNVDFAPRDTTQVSSFLQNVTTELPIESAARLALKVRTDKRTLLRQTDVEIAQGADDEDDDDIDEIGEDDDDGDDVSMEEEDE